MKKSEAITYFGGSRKLADALGISKQAVSRWTDIPGVRQYQVQVLSDGRLLADEKVSVSA